MGVATETYAEMEAALLDAVELHLEGGAAPIGWTLTTEMYRQLDYGGDHFQSADRAIFYGEPPKELYQLPVGLEDGAHHAWGLRFERGPLPPA
ncbi:MAG TPA: hypothetical protein VGO55_03280 [Allosphingosinicella sp.]|nr:hypothetical protein [Allosphingosinicella sp.]